MKRDFESVLYKNVRHIFSALFGITSGYAAMKGDYKEAFGLLAIAVIIEVGDNIYRKMENRLDSRRNSDELYWG